MSARKAIVVGGSLGGLFAALSLRRVGWEVDVYERSPGVLESRGGGIVQQPEIATVFDQAGLDPEGPPGVVSGERIFLDRDGSIRERLWMPQKQTSWGAMWTAMRSRLPDDRYHAGKELLSFAEEGETVTARFKDGATASGALLVAADGGGSTVRAQLLPRVERTYSGYVAFRGLVSERDVDAPTKALLAERFSFFDEPGTQMLCYLVAGEHARRFNWVWYRNADDAALARVLTSRDGRRRPTSVPPGELGPATERELREAAARILPPPYRALVAATEEPFVQGIFDLVVPRMAFGRVALLGDAAFTPRPHTAASTSKAAANALALAEALVAEHQNVERALARWEPAQLALGANLYARGKMLGDRSLRARDRSQDLDVR